MLIKKFIFCVLMVGGAFQANAMENSELLSAASRVGRITEKKVKTMNEYQFRNV